MTSDATEKSRILVCDDSKLVRVTANKILGERFDLVLSEDGQQGWDKIVNDPKIQVVFTDLGMPNLDGYGLIERVRNSTDERIRNLPMIVITGAGEDENVKKRIYELGATDFITKPFTPTAILARADAHTNYVKISHELQNNVNKDLVTNVYNRKGFDEKFAKDLSFARRHGENLVVAIFALDKLSEIHNRLNEKLQNRILKEVAKVLVQAVRKEDSVSRDGMRFIISFPMAKTDGVIELSRRLCAKISGFKVKIGENDLRLTTSVGIGALVKGHDATIADLMQCAERALSNAKALGPGEVQLLKVEDDEEDAREDEAEISIDEALESLALGKHDFVMEKMDAIVSTLKPLFSLLTKKQRREIFPDD